MDLAWLKEALKDPEVRDLVRQTLAPKFLTPVEFATPVQYAELHNVGRSTIFEWLKAGLPSYKQGKVRRIPVVEADQWLKEGGGTVLLARRGRSKRPS